MARDLFADVVEAVAQRRMHGIDYGRADFGIVRGRVEIYEINTNPAMSRMDEHPNADRIAAYLTWAQRYCDALAAIDRLEEGTVANDDLIFSNQRREDKEIPRDRFVI